jgi:uncharacterized protein
MSYPSEEVILALHKKYTPNNRAFEIVYKHCKIVDEIARQLIAQHRLALLNKDGYEPEGAG